MAAGCTQAHNCFPVRLDVIVSPSMFILVHEIGGTCTAAGCTVFRGYQHQHVKGVYGKLLSDFSVNTLLWMEKLRVCLMVSQYPPGHEILCYGLIAIPPARVKKHSNTLLIRVPLQFVSVRAIQRTCGCTGSCHRRIIRTQAQAKSIRRSEQHTLALICCLDTGWVFVDIRSAGGRLHFFATQPSHNCCDNGQGHMNESKRATMHCYDRKEKTCGQLLPRGCRLAPCEERAYAVPLMSLRIDLAPPCVDASPPCHKGRMVQWQPLADRSFVTVK